MITILRPNPSGYPSEPQRTEPTAATPEQKSVSDVTLSSTSLYLYRCMQDIHNCRFPTDLPSADKPTDTDPALKLGELFTKDNPTDADLATMFGATDGQKVREVLNTRSDVTVSDLGAFRGNSSDLNSLCTVLAERPDLNYDDCVQRDSNRGITLLTVLQMQAAVKLLEVRKDVNPRELQAMRSGISQSSTTLPMGDEGFTNALGVLEKRADVRPQQLMLIRPSVIPPTA